MLRLKQRTGVQRIRGLAASVVLAASLVVMLVGALVPHAWAFALAGLASYAADLYLHRKEPKFMRRLGQLRAGVTLRALLRGALLLVLIASLPYTDDHTPYVATILVPVLLLLQALFSALNAAVRRFRTMPVSTRNIDLGRLRITDRPPRVLVGWPGQRLLHCELVVLAGLCATARTLDSTWITLGLGLAVAVSALTLLALIPYAVQARGFPEPERVLGRIDTWLGQYRPVAVLYFSGSRSSAYQVNMWLETLAALDVRVLVVLRERYLLPRLKQTDLPVLCVPSAVHLMNLDLSSVRVALYPANVGKNIHLLRVPTIKHVFIGHGDSDKLASVNPYSKVYDEVWVAGRAGRDRYSRAGVGVQSADIVEVGRPQLDAVRVADPAARPAEVPTVLYAPTWEGWTDDPGNTSLILAGENIVRELLGSARPVRLIYKPHPFTGSRSPEARRVHERIIHLIGRANVQRAAQVRFQEPEQVTEQREAARRELAELADRLAAIRAALQPKGADEAQRSRDGALPDPALRAEAEALRARRHRVHWEALAPWEHQVVQGPHPTLYECFDHADLLISDISSVVSDFIASLKPYALTDTAELGVYEFCRRNTAARAAYILSSDARQVRDLIGLLFDPGKDVLREGRKRLKEYLLGPDSLSSLARFNAALNALARRGDGELRRREASFAPPLPSPSPPSLPLQ